MSETLFPATITNKVHKETAIQMATFLGGPLIAGYLIAENYRQLGEHQKVKTWIWAIVGFIVLMALAAVIPDSVPNVVFAAMYTGVTYVVVKKYQSTQIQAHIEAGGAIYKTSRAVLIGIIGALLFFSIILGGFFLIDKLFTLNG